LNDRDVHRTPKAGAARPAILVRDATPDDLHSIVLFNAALAQESEGKILDRDVLTRGVREALRDPARLRYWVAHSPELDSVVGQAAINAEWTDWRFGWIWWLQSVYVRADVRRLGVFRALHAHIRTTARECGDVVGLRLYVERANATAQRTYESLGFRPGAYHVYEDIWPDRFGGRSGAGD
jgi:GNAT superfamily N-acetyltransferase